MSFAGHVLAAIQSLRANKAILKKRVPFKKAERYSATSAGKRGLHRQPLTAENRKWLKQKLVRLKKTAKKNTRQKLIATSIITLLLIYLVYALINFYLQKMV